MSRRGEKTRGSSRPNSRFRTLLIDLRRHMHAFHHKLSGAVNTVGAIMLALLCHGALAQDNNATIAVGYQRGLAYLPVILMEQQHLFEKHATRLGLKTTAE